MLRDALAVAIEALSWIELEKMSARAAFQRAVRQLQVRDREALGMAYREVLETTRRLNLLDRILEEAVGRAGYEELPFGPRAFLRILAYESAIVQRRPIDALRYVKASREILGWESLHPIEQHLGKLLAIEASSVLRGLPDIERTALRLSAPEWLVTYLYRLFGRAEALRVLSGLSILPPMYFRLNSLKGKPEDTAKRLEEAGLGLVEVPSVRGLCKVSGGQLSIPSDEVIREGLVCVEDLSTAYAVENLGVVKGGLVLDVCTVSGARTGHMAELMGNEGMILSVELSRRRARAWTRETRRLGVQNAQLVLADVGSLPSDAEFDAVVVDPPCSGVGTWARDPSGKWTSSPEMVSRSASTQWRILESCADRVRSRGVLLYFTNTITVEENEENILRLLRRHPEFKLVELKPALGSEGLRGLTLCRRLYPHRDACYTSFLAKLVKED